MAGFRVLTAAGVSLLSLSAAAFAQEQPPNSPDPGTAAEANEAQEAPADAGSVIVVEARRRDESIQDVPLTVNAVTAETIEKLNLRNFTEITSVVPGLTLMPNANGIGSSSSMRGVNQDVNVSGENGTIQYYFNDAPVASNFVLQAMYDLGQIEVLRGPQGTLRGRSTPSGSITVAPRRPDLDEAGATVVGTLASHDTYNVQFGLNVPVIADKVAVRIAGLTQENAVDRVRSLASTIDPEGKTDSIRASIRAEPTDWLRAGFIYQSLDNRIRAFDQVQSFSNFVPAFTPTVVQNISPLPPGTIVASPALTSPRANFGVITPGDRLGVQSFPRTVSQDFKFYGWNAAADYAGQSLIYVGSKLTFAFNPITNSDPGATFPALTLTQNTLTRSTGDTHEIRLQNLERVAGLFDYVVGYFRSDSHPVTNLTVTGLLRLYIPVPVAPGVTGLLAAPQPFLPPPLNAIPPVLTNPTAIFIPRADTKEESFFGNLVAHLGEATEISAGLRRIKASNDVGGLFISCTPAQFAAGTCRQTPGTENDFVSKKTIYNVSTRHRFNDDLMVYATTGSSFRPPVTAIGDFSAMYSPLETAHTSLAAETSKSYELGVKSEWFDNTLVINLTAFRQNFKNYPFRAASGIYFININAQGQAERGQFNFVSAVPVRVTGLESEISWSPSRLIRFSAVTSYADSKIKKGTLLACSDVDRNGIPDPFVPTLAQLQAAYGAEHLAECPATGQSATFLPKLSGSVQGEAGLPVNEGADAYLRGLLAWRGKSKIDPNNPFDDVGAYGLFNAYAGLRDPDGAWEVSLFAKNLFKTTKITSAGDSPFSQSITYINAAAGAPFGSASYDSFYSGVTVTPPREFGVTARMAIGSR